MRLRICIGSKSVGNAESRLWPTFCRGAMVVILFLTISRASYGLDSDEILLQRFLTEAPAKWKELRERTKVLQGTITSYAKDDNIVQQHKTFEIYFNRTGKKVIEQSLLASDPDGAVYALNAEYVFALARDSPAAPWVITEFDERGTDHVPDKIAQKLTMMTEALESIISLGGEALPDVVSKPNFKVKHIASIQQGSRELVEIEFEYPNDFREGQKGPFIPVQGGVMRLDPNRFWCVDSMNLRIRSRDGTASRRFSVEIVDLQSPFPVPKRAELMEEWKLTDGGVSTNSNVSEFELTEPRRLPDDDSFRLSAFGLPEPPGHPLKRPTPIYIWVIIAAIGCGLLAIGLRYLARRGAAAG
jgi:hypothetical protein